MKPQAATLILSVAAALAFRFLRVPLPFMLGPMCAVGWYGVSGYGPKEIPGGRQAGQLVIGCSLGLYFTNEVIRLILNSGVYLLASSFAAILIGAVSALLFKKIAGVTASSAFFACVPGGAAEMATLAERAGARFDTVALSHSIRMLIVVLLVPISVTLSGTVGSAVFEPAAAAFSPAPLAGMLIAAVAAACLFAKCKIPNAWLLAPLLVGVLLTVSGSPVSSVPTPLVNAAQILFGASLGSRFSPRFRTESRRQMVAAVVTSFFTLLATTLLGVVFAWKMDESAAALILAVSPGGLSEMCITAKILRLGVPLVTAFQVARLVIVVLFALPAWRCIAWAGKALSRKNETP